MAELKIRQVVRMPDVSGQPLVKARLMVENAGLTLDAVLFRESYEERNTVLEQRPPRGQMVYAGDPVTLWIARTGYTEYLPAIYRRSDAAGRNLSRDICWLFEHMFGQIDATLDDIHFTFDPQTTPEEFLPWLAGWVAMVVDLDWPVTKKRAILSRAVELYGIRGTVKGLKLFLKTFTNHEPTIFENKWPFRGFRVEPDIDPMTEPEQIALERRAARIGVDSVILPPVNLNRCFIVEMPVRFTDASSEMVVRIHNIIAMERPANTHYYLRFASESSDSELREFFQIGMRSGIGIGDEVLEEGTESESEAR